jgi:hypothetical protein
LSLFEKTQRVSNDLKSVVLQISGQLRRKLEIGPRSKVFWVRISSFRLEQRGKSKRWKTFVANGTDDKTLIRSQKTRNL